MIYVCYIGFIFALHYMNCELPNLLEEREAFKDWKQIPIFFGTLMFSIEALGMVKAIDYTIYTNYTYYI